MPPFPKPDFEYEYDLPTQRTALREWRDDERHVPGKAPDRLLIATWNVATPPSPLMVSAPAKPTTTSRPFVPVMTSLSTVPTRVGVRPVQL